MSAAGWTAIGLAIGTYLNRRFIAKRLGIYTHKAKDSLTIPEFITNRFQEKTRIYHRNYISFHSDLLHRLHLRPVQSRRRAVQLPDDNLQR